LEEKDQPVAVPAEMVHSHWELWGWADPAAEPPVVVEARWSHSDRPDSVAEPREADLAEGVAAGQPVAEQD